MVGFEIDTKEWVSYIEKMKKELSAGEDWQKELDVCLKMSDAAKSGDKNALLDLAAYKAFHGIDFEKSVVLLEKMADADNVFALNTLGFLYCTGAFNPFDDSKGALVQINTKESEEKAEWYFKKASELGSVHAMSWFALRDCMRVALESDDADENTEPLSAEDFLKAEKSVLKAIEESKKDSCDCIPEVIEILYGWLSAVYASKNPLNPIYDEEKAKYWEGESLTLQKQLSNNL